MTRITAALTATLLATGVLTVAELTPLGAAEPVAAAPSTSQAWVTAVSSVTGTGVGAQRTLTFDTIEFVAGGALALLLGGGALLVIVMRRRRRDA